jgi:hypothetical protein
MEGAESFSLQVEPRVYTASLIPHPWTGQFETRTSPLILSVSPNSPNLTGPSHPARGGLKPHRGATSPCLSGHWVVLIMPFSPPRPPGSARPTLTAVNADA